MGTKHSIEMYCQWAGQYSKCLFIMGATCQRSGFTEIMFHLVEQQALNELGGRFYFSVIVTLILCGHTNDSCQWSYTSVPGQVYNMNHRSICRNVQNNSSANLHYCTCTWKTWTWKAKMLKYHQWSYSFHRTKAPAGRERRGNGVSSVRLYKTIQLHQHITWFLFLEGGALAVLV